jgi:hypothetical protein
MGNRMMIKDVIGPIKLMSISGTRENLRNERMLIYLLIHFLSKVWRVSSFKV